MASTKQEGTRTVEGGKENEQANVAANAVNEPAVAASHAVLVAEEGEVSKAETGSPEAKLAKDLKAAGVDKVSVWHDESLKLYYADMFKDGLHRLLSVTEDAMEDKDIDCAKTLYAQADFDKQDEAVKAEKEADKE